MSDEIIKLRTIEGSGGGKSGQRTPVESPNTLRSRSTIKVVEVLSEGEITGVVGGLKGVYFNDTVVQNSDGTYNFPAVKFDTRNGTSDQTYIPGFPSVESALGINTQILYATPVTRTTSGGGIDAVRVLVRLPTGLQEVDTKNGDQRGYRVGIAIDTRPVGGVWQQVFNTTITGKSVTPYEEAYRIEKPNGVTGQWQIRVRRTSKESETNNISDRVDWFAMTEIQDIKVTYPNAAIAAIALDAESTGGQVPTRSYLVDGIIVKVPTNYFPTQYDANGNITSYAYYSGVWNGSFKWSRCDDPAWIVYDMLTNTRYGAGNEIDEADIDVYSFYEASQYNCQLIDDGNGNLVPRFRCNMSIMSREDSYKALNAVLGNCRSYLFTGAGYISLIQDRPQTPRKNINNAQVVDGVFEYSGTELSNRVTAVDVTFSDRLDNYNPRTVTEQASPADIARYGYRKIDIAAIGVVDEHQARIMAKWAYDTSLSATEFVNFQVSWQNADLEVGQVVNIYDNFRIGAEVSGLIKSATLVSGNTYNLTLDRAHYVPGTSTEIANGATLKVMTLDGIERSGTLSNVSVDESLPTGDIGITTATWTASGTSVDELPGLPYVVVSVIQPRQFRITKIDHASEGVYGITAILHDPNKYARVESGIVTEAPIFDVFSASSIAAPNNPIATPESYINPQGVLRYRLRLNWDKVVDPYLKGYKVRWRRENNQYQWTDLLLQNEFIIEDALLGIYEFSIYAYNTRNIQSPSRDYYYDLTTLDGNLSPSAPPTNLRMVGGGNTFEAEQFTIEWNAPVFTPDAVLLDYQVTIENVAGTVQYEVFNVPLTQLSLKITKEDIIRWCGFALRDIRIEVRARDTLNRLTLPATPIVTTPASTIVFSNLAPPALTGVSVLQNVDYYTVTHDDYTGAADAVGIVIHHSTTSGFTPSSANIALDAVGTLHIVPATPDTTYYVRVAAYDLWSKELLNYSPEFTVTTGTDVVGINPVAPTGLAASSVITVSPTGVESATITVSWNRSTNTTLYDLELTNLTTGSSQIITVSQPDSGSVTYSFDGIPGHSYRFRVRSRAATNVSAWTAYVNHTAAADTAGPGAATGLSVTPAYSAMSLTWTNPADEDLVAMEIWRRVGSSGTGALVTTVAYPLTFFYDANLPIGNSYSYRIRGVDRSGNLGTYTAWSTAQTVANVPAGSVGNAALAANAVTAVNILNGTITGAEIAALTILGNNIANGTIGSGQIAANGIQSTNISDGAVVSRVIAANAVLASNIAAGAITTDKLAANAITADKIAANTITANQIAANTITANQIQANTITANQIAANTISTGQLAANSITAGLIQADAIQSVHIATGAVTADSVSTNQIITNAANIADAVITNAKITGTIQSSNYVAGSTGWSINKTDGSAEFGNVLVRGEIDGSTINTSVLSLNSARILSSGDRLCPFLIYDMGYASNPSGVSSFTVTLSGFVGPSEGAIYEYAPKRFARQKMDVYLNADVDGDTGYETVYIDVQYDGGTWTNIESLRTNCNYRGGMSLGIRYTTLDSAWNTVAFRARTTENNTQVLNFSVQVFNFNESANAAGSDSGTNSTGGGGGTTPPREDWCVDLNSYMLSGGIAGHVAANDMIACYNNQPESPNVVYLPVQMNRIGRSECLRLVTTSGASVIASVTTPMTLRDDSCVLLPEMLGKEALVSRDGQFVWEEVVSLEPLGERLVAKISVSEQCFFAGAEEGVYIATHNIITQKP